jgi:hypothetical protein
LLEALGIVGTAGPDAAALAAWAASEARSAGVAWATCPRPEFLLRLAASLGLPRREVIAAAAAVVERLHPVLSSDADLVRAMAAVARFVDGGGRSADCWAAAYGLARRADEASQRPAHDPIVVASLRAVAALALACDADADDAYWSQRASVAEAAAHAAAALEACGVRAREVADAVRERLPYERVARAIRLARASSAHGGRSSGFYSTFDDAATAAGSTAEETGAFGR